MISQMTLTEYRKPPLDVGDYTISVSQAVTAAEIQSKDTASAQFSNSLNFSVRGPRFSLDPPLISEVFPPEGSQGDHSNVLPHVILTRSTLPWERSPGGADGTVAPWLALLLFSEDETQQVQTCTMSLKELREQTGASFPSDGTWPQTTDVCAGPKLTAESGDNADDRVTVIQLSQSLYEKNMVPPTVKQLSLLAHVRATTDPAGEVAVIVGSRLPKVGGSSTVHLVSVEGRYDTSGKFVYPTKDTVIRLVSLKSWRFACNSGEAGFKDLLAKLTTDELNLPLPNSIYGAPNITARWSPPDPMVTAAITYRDMGCAPLPHAMRQGNRSISWYHGPFVPGLVTVSNAAKLPVHAADALVLYNQTSDNKTFGMFDVSYAAAWQLGRLLALGSKSLSKSLYRWKRRHTAMLKNASKAAKNPPAATLTATSADLDLPFPQDVSDWLASLGKLDGVPLRYLVPDERMLPLESIRFFQVDSYWVKCVIDGAFSIGRALDSDSESDADLWTQHLAPHVPEQASGFLVRSDVVAGWPGLMVKGYDTVLNKTDPTPATALTSLRMERLSKNILLCLFDGLVQTVDVYLKPESLHFGLDGNGAGVTTDPSRVLKFSAVLTNSATFATQMIAGADSVRFSASS